MSADTGALTTYRSGALTQSESGQEYHDVFEALLPMQERARVTCALLMHLPQVAQQLNEGILEAKALTGWLFKITDNEFQQVHQRIENSELTHQQGLTELFMRCAQGFNEAEAKMQCSESNQKLLYEMIVRAQTDAQATMATTEMAAMKLTELAGGFESLLSALAKLQKVVTENRKSSETKEQELGETVKEAALAFADCKRQYTTLRDRVEDNAGTMFQAMTTAEDSRKKLREVLETGKVEIEEHSRQIEDLKKTLETMKSTTHADSLRTLVEDLQSKTVQMRQRVDHIDSIAEAMSTTQQKEKELGERVSQLVSQVSTLQVTIGRYQSDIFTLKASHATLLEAYTKIAARLDTLEGGRGMTSPLPKDPTLTARIEELEMAVRQGSTSTMARIEGLEANFPARQESTAVPVGDLQRQIDELSRKVHESLSSNRESSLSSTAETAHSLTLAQSTVKTRGYVQTFDTATLPLFSHCATDVAALKVPYGYPYSIHDDMSPLIVAVAELCKSEIDVLKTKCEGVIKHILKPNQPRGHAFNTIVQGTDKQAIAEMLTALTVAKTKEDRQKIFSWFVRARFAKVQTRDATLWKREAAGTESITLTIGEAPIKLESPLNF